ncbi:MAG TPA: signal peptidase II [Casimicrobiaceae bacterium]|nr:signal peptidase II [Casimicrobiaceae bacterium]
MSEPASAANARRWIALAAAIVVVDQVTKAAIQSTLEPGEAIAVLPILSIVLVFNTGAAFSFLAGGDGWQRWLFSGIAIAAAVFILWLIRQGGGRVYLAGLALILGGAIGNLVDRLLLGHVVDFILVHWRDWSYPAFNVADSAITIGAILLVVDSFRHRRADAPAAP